MSNSSEPVLEWQESMLRKALWGVLLVTIVIVILGSVQRNPIAVIGAAGGTVAVALSLWKRQWPLEMRVISVVLAGTAMMTGFMQANGFLTPVNHAAYVGFTVFAGLMMSKRLTFIVIGIFALQYLVIGVYFVAGDREPAVATMLDLSSAGNWLRSGILTFAIVAVTASWVLLVITRLKSSLSESQLLLENLRAESEGRIRALEKSASLDEELRQSQKLEAVGAIASGVAHDFNNLLVAIMGQSQLIRYSVANPRVKERCDAILAASEQASALTGQLLAFSSRDRGAQSSIDVAEELGRTRRILERVLPTNIDFDFELPEEDLGQVYASPSDLGQIVLNLCVNARDAMEDGGTLTVRVRRAGSGSRRTLELVVSDTGEGIPDEIREQIFEPFFTTKESGKGTGIGLSLVSRVTEAMGGTVEVESELGVGTTFTVKLPSHEGQTKSGEEASTIVAGAGQRILVLDDDAGVREVMASMLSEAGYRTHVFSRAAEALTWYDEEEPEVQLVITDAVMPGQGGFAFFQELYNRGYRGPCLVCSGYSGVVPPSFFEDSSRRFLAKPFREEALLSEVASLVTAR